MTLYEARAFYGIYDPWMAVKQW